MALEPLQLPAEAFRRSVVLNGWQGRVHVVQAAASDRVGYGTFHLVGHVQGNPFAYASSEPHPGTANGSAPQEEVRLTTLARVLQQWRGMRPRAPSPGTERRPLGARSRARLLKLYVFGGLPRVLRGAPPGFARHFTAAWLALAADHYASPAGMAMRLGSFFARRGFALAAPDVERLWCHGRRHGVAGMLQHLRHRFRSSRPGLVLPIVAFRPGWVACGRQSVIEHGRTRIVNSTSVRQAGGRSVQ